ncbi:acyl carrier protein [Microbispora sp. RL4-1S]|uniref:Acyl carrier protein n=1 Tax=Microbispora oryzae TaxID=2806554 RepID=A0A940WC45_9ACTN|nr:acyl carrier protein [Microbispora oryzae]MBP2702770.1 acyl carrier protein [Microbispora oryzae]
MSETQVIDRGTIVIAISAALADVLKREADQIAEGTRLFDDLGLDSTSVLELLMRIEDDLGVEFDTDTLEQRHFETVGTLADYVAEQA